MKKSDLKQNQSGFTLLELIMGIFMFSVVIVGIFALSTYYLTDYSFSFEENQSIQIAQNGLTRMIRDIREIRNGDNGSWPIVSAGDNEFIFYCDATNDGRTDRIRYFIDGNSIKKGLIEPTAVPVSYPTANEVITTVVTDLESGSGPLFTYYNGNWPGDQINNPLITAERILNTRFVSVYFKISISDDFAAEPFELSSGVNIRSMKDNL